jgi:hypothetical protein
VTPVEQLSPACWRLLALAELVVVPGPVGAHEDHGEHDRCDDTDGQEGEAPDDARHAAVAVGQEREPYGGHDPGQQVQPRDDRPHGERSLVQRDPVDPEAQERDDRLAAVVLAQDDQHHPGGQQREGGAHHERTEEAQRQGWRAGLGVRSAAPVVAHDPPAGAEGLHQRRRHEQCSHGDVPGDQAADVEQGEQLGHPEHEQHEPGPGGEHRVARRPACAGEHGVVALLAAEGHRHRLCDVLVPEQVTRGHG